VSPTFGRIEGRKISDVGDRRTSRYRRKCQESFKRFPAAVQALEDAEQLVGIASIIWVLLTMTLNSLRPSASSLKGSSIVTNIFPLFYFFVI
jgi:hypothetical protein